ncbi:histidine triad nucleotide-binding protein [Patescibacteria group bacterium]|nr:histidine triad nucleotide-binding protein [Patescibacteria group bacterium]
MSEDCIFCKIVGKEIESEFVYEDEEMIAFKDINPRAPIHVLFVSKKHIEKVSDVKGEDEKLLGRMVVAAKEYAAKKGVLNYKLQFNVGKKGGQEVFHLHLHLMGWREE